MKILITAGSTNIMIDKVRCISNIFKGSTGSAIARYIALNIDDSKPNDIPDVTLITSNPTHNLIDRLGSLRVLPYKTYDELYSLMEKEITTGNYDVIIHSAAVSDYKVDGTFSIVRQECLGGEQIGYSKKFSLSKIDSSKKISSSNPELFLKLVPTEKIIDKIREPWGFKGKLVKFKLQVGISDKELLDIATKSMATSKADFIVANCLEWANEKAYIIKKDSVDGIACVSRDRLAKELFNMITER